MKDRSSTAAAPGVLDDGPWSELVSLETERAGKGPRMDPPAIHGAIVGTIAGFIDDVPLVTYPGQVGDAGVPCRTLIDVGPDSAGRRALLMFEEADVRRPILIGCFKEQEPPGRSAPTTVEVRADGERVTVTARDQIVLRCGTASITLTKAGKLIMQGEYISQRSTGVVRIKGGCVEIN